MGNGISFVFIKKFFEIAALSNNWFSALALAFQERCITLVKKLDWSRIILQSTLFVRNAAPFTRLKTAIGLSAVPRFQKRVFLLNFLIIDSVECVILAGQLC